jgi:hypothetical protein
MDYVFSQTKMFTREVAKPREKRPPLASFVQIAEQNGMVIKSCKNDVRDCEYIKEYLRRCRSQIDELRIGLKGLDADEKYQRQQEIEDIYREAIGYVTKKLRRPYMLKYLLQNVDEGLSDSESDEKKFYWILFEALCLEQNRFFYKVLSDTRDEDIYYLIPDENGEDEIYGIRHSKRSKLERI